MNERLLYLRKTLLGLSRVKFGQAVGMSDSEIKNIETGVTQLKENKIPLICSAYNVSEPWLRTGEGEPFLPKTRDQEIQEIVRGALTHPTDEAQRFFCNLFSGMSDAEILLMYEIFRRRFGP